MPLQGREPFNPLDYVGDLLPIILTIVIGVLVVGRRVVEVLLRRKQEEGRAAPAPAAPDRTRPTLHDEVRRYMDMLQRDLGRSPEVEEGKPEPIRQPAVAPGRASAAEPTPLPQAAQPARTREVAIATPVRRSRTATGQAVDLRVAFVWSEVLGPPLALRPPSAHEIR